MDTIYKNYIDLYGNFSHILNIKIDKSVSEDEKRIILFDIYDLINEKDITHFFISNAYFYIVKII